MPLVDDAGSENDGTNDCSGYLSDSFFTANEHDSNGAYERHCLSSSSKSSIGSTGSCIDTNTFSIQPRSGTDLNASKLSRTPHLDHVLSFQQQFGMGDVGSRFLPYPSESLGKNSHQIWEDQATLNFQCSVHGENEESEASQWESILSGIQSNLESSTLTSVLPSSSPTTLSYYASGAFSRSAPNLLSGESKWDALLLTHQNSCPTLALLQLDFEEAKYPKPAFLGQNRRSSPANAMGFPNLSPGTFCREVDTLISTASLSPVDKTKSLETIRFAEDCCEAPDSPHILGEAELDFELVLSTNKSAPNGLRLGSKRTLLRKQLRRLKKVVNRILA